MRSITLSAEDDLIEAAEARARAGQTTLDEQFRRWLAEYTHRSSKQPAPGDNDEARRMREEQAERAMAIIEKISSYTSSGGRKFTREEMNER